MKRCIRITVYGTVQGVGYREYVQKYAKKFDVEGTIQNVDDGSVLINAAGNTDALDDLIDYIYQGSKDSVIEEVAIEIAVSKRDYRGVFRVIGAE